MKRQKRSGVFFLIAGAVLLIAALSLYLYNRYESNQAAKASEHLLADLQKSMKETTPKPGKEHHALKDTGMKVMEVTERDVSVF